MLFPCTQWWHPPATGSISQIWKSWQDSLFQSLKPLCFSLSIPLFTRQIFTEGLSCVKHWARITTINRNICCGCLVTKSCRPPYDLTVCSLPGSSVHGISQTRMIERVSLAFSRGSSWPKDWTQVSCNCRQILYHRSHSVQFSRSVVSNSLRPHEMQHTRPPCPSPTPGVH